MTLARIERKHSDTSKWSALVLPCRFLHSRNWTVASNNNGRQQIRVSKTCGGTRPFRIPFYSYFFTIFYSRCMLYLKLFLLAGLIWIFEIISFHVEDGRLHRSWFWWVCGMAIFLEFIPTMELCLNGIWTEVLSARFPHRLLGIKSITTDVMEINLNCYFFLVGMLCKSTSVLKAITLLKSNLSAFPLLLLQIQTKVTTWVLFFRSRFLIDSINCLHGVLIFFVLIVWRQRIKRELSGRKVLCFRCPASWAQLKDDEQEQLAEEEGRWLKFK